MATSSMSNPKLSELLISR